jgi:flagellar biosynthetic protein FlhB
VSESDQEKTEEATPERQRKAREEGQFPRAKDLGNTAASVLVLMVLAGSSERISSLVGNFTRRCFQDLDVLVRGELSIPLHAMGLTLIALVVPLVLAAAVGGTAAGFAEAGFHPNMDLIGPKWERLAPLGKLQQMFSPMKAATTISMQLLRLGVVAAVAYYAIRRSFPELIQLSASSNAAASAKIVEALLHLAIQATLVLGVMVAVEYGNSWLQHQKSIRMTREEIKEEFKSQEGDPRVRARQRARAREMAKRSVVQAVKDADFVIANPTHVSVAIRYRAEEGAPVVATKGYDEVALHIRSLAKEHGIPIVENIPLARALAKRVKIGRQIPVDLYAAVAEVLAFVYRIKNRRYTA